MASLRIPVAPAVLLWALERAQVDRDELATRFKKLPNWLNASSAPTFNQLQDLATALHVPMGFLLLPDPPEDPLPLPDFRTMRNRQMLSPSPDLIDTIHSCEQRQEWFHDYVVKTSGEPLDFVGSVNLETPPADAASHIRNVVGFELTERAAIATWADTVLRLTDRIEATGVLVMINGVVGGNTHRKLNPEEFRGFAIADNFAPLIFVNGADSKAAQIFTLVHELAHIWLGESAISDATVASNTDHQSELWCNKVAAEVLAPKDWVASSFNQDKELRGELDRLARTGKVSTLVVLRQIYECGLLSWESFDELYRQELDRVVTLATVGGSDGGNYYNSQPYKVSRRFARAVITDAMEGSTQFTEAFRLLGVRKTSTFDEFSRQLGVA